MKKLTKRELLIEKHEHFDEIDEKGSLIWRNKRGEIHRNYDLPAVISVYGTKIWCKNNKIHREKDMPAMIFDDGDKHWYKNGLQHRDNNLPAVVFIDNKHGLYYKKGIQYFLKQNKK